MAKCIECGKEFVPPPNSKRVTCSHECHMNLSHRKTKDSYNKGPPKLLRKKLPPEPSDRKSVRSSFTEDELNISRIIITTLSEFPVCRCNNSEGKMRIEPIGNEFKASCAWCGFEATTVGGRWVGIETVKVERRRLVM